MKTNLPILPIWIVLAAAICCTPFATAQDQPEQRTDSDVRFAIEKAYMFDSTVPINSIDVTVADGIATLDGTVTSLLAEDRAVKIAGTIRGVRSVVNQITVHPFNRPDEEIASAVKAQLFGNPATQSMDIGVSVEDAEATLTGEVDSWQEWDLAEKIASGVHGLSAIKNEMEVSFDDPRDAAEIITEIEKGLDYNVWLAGREIAPAYEDGVVSLSGTVGSVTEKEIAEAEAHVAGVKRVNSDDLEVNPSINLSEERPRIVAKSDDELKDAIQDALLYDPRVLSYKPEVHVNDGDVTLAGTASSLQAKRAAAADARNTLGVLSVENHIKVRPDAEVSDPQLELRTIQALERDTITESYEINVSAEEGRVTLAGNVDNAFEKAHAEKVVSGVPGVSEIRNRLEIEDPEVLFTDYVFDPLDTYDPTYLDSPAPIPAVRNDEELLNQVVEELFWSPFVDSNQIEVSVENGVVTLDGEVDTWGEYHAALTNAREAGARAINDELLIAPDLS